MYFEGGNTAWEHDARGRVIRATQRVSGNQQVYTTTRYAYSQGDLTTITYPSGKRLDLQRNAAGQVVVLLLDGQTVLDQVAYLPFTQSARGWQWANGTAYRKTYDRVHRVTSYPLGSVTRSLNYDVGSRILNFRHTNTPSWDQNFEHDDLHRLLSMSSSTMNQRFTFDANGNRQSAEYGANSYPYSVSANSRRLGIICFWRCPISICRLGEGIFGGCLFWYGGKYL